MARPRRNLDLAKLNERFGAHFQGLMDAAGLTAAELRKRMAGIRIEISEQGIRNWMRGDRYPSAEMMEALARIFGLPDYRHVLPPPHKPRK
jgi:transcriptional regulator with XRE-family HTH domain